MNLVVNCDLPPDAATYFHRVGRTGRFGSLGISVTLLTPGELPLLRSFLGSHGQVEARCWPLFFCRRLYICLSPSEIVHLSFSVRDCPLIFLRQRL